MPFWLESGRGGPAFGFVFNDHTFQECLDNLLLFRCKTWRLPEPKGGDRHRARPHQHQKSTHLHSPAERQRAVESHRAWVVTRRFRSAVPGSRADCRGSQHIPTGKDCGVEEYMGETDK